MSTILIFIVKTAIMSFDYNTKFYNFGIYESEGSIKSVYTNKDDALKHGVPEASRYLRQHLLDNFKNINWADYTSENITIERTKDGVFLEKTIRPILREISKQMISVEVWKQTGTNTRLTYCYSLNNINNEITTYENIYSDNSRS